MHPWPWRWLATGYRYAAVVRRAPCLHSRAGSGHAKSGHWLRGPGARRRAPLRHHMARDHGAAAKRTPMTEA
eukprot:scaffold107_cov106-Isochrysis_galbana.AAC.20